MSETETTERTRLDELLVARGLAETRTQAKALIVAGRVTTRGGRVLDKPGKEYAGDIELTVARPPRIVRREGEKLAAFLERFAIDFAGRHVLDVGQGQLHPRLRDDARVTNLEKINARHLTADMLPRPGYDAVVMDLSFISLRAVLPAVWPVLVPGGVLIALVKPQFDAGKEAVDRGDGVIRDPAVQEVALSDLPGATLLGEMGSNRQGAKSAKVRGE